MLALVSFTSLCCAQTPDTLGTIYSGVPKNKGSIKLSNGKEVSGNLDYNAHKNSVKLNEKTFYTPADVESFEYVDGLYETKRSFIAQDLTFDDQPDLNGRYFLEVFQLNDTLSLLDLNFPTSLERNASRYAKSSTLRQRAGYGGRYDTHNEVYRDKLVSRSIEILYFMVGNNLYPYVFRSTKEVDDLAGTSLTGGSNKSKTKVYDKTLLQRVTGAQYASLKKSAAKEKLDWEEKEDLLRIFGYKRK